MGMDLRETKLEFSTPRSGLQPLSCPSCSTAKYDSINSISTPTRSLGAANRRKLLGDFGDALRAGASGKTEHGGRGRQ